jgi:hypothetical protein
VANDEISHEIRRFLYERVASYEQLEVLIWLAEHPDGVRLEVVESMLGIPGAEEALAGLVEVKLVARSAHSTYRYQPANEELDSLTRQVIRTYRANRFGVVKAMTDNSLQRLRGSALHTFAECFLIGGPKKDG